MTKYFQYYIFRNKLGPNGAIMTALNLYSL